MPKKALSVTLDETNILWLRARTAAAGFRSLSDTLDRLVSDARTSGRTASATMRSVVGTIDIAASDPRLDTADAALRRVYDASLLPPVVRSAARRKPLKRATRRGRR